MSKKPTKKDEDRWPTPAEEYGVTPVPFAPAEERGTGWPEKHVSSQKSASREETEDVLDITDINYIDWSDLQVPSGKQTRVVSPKGSHDSSRKSSTDAPMGKESMCPIPTCKKLIKRLKHHAWEFHNPPIFKDKIDDKLEEDRELQRLRGSAIVWLAQQILGPKATVHDLVRHVNGIARFIPANCSMMERCQIHVGNLSRAMNWYTPKESVYTMYPINSPAVLMQWRVLVTLMATLTVQQRATFRRMGRDRVAALSTKNPSDKRVSPVKKGYNYKLLCRRGEKNQMDPVAHAGMGTPGSGEDARSILNRKRQAVTDAPTNCKARRTDPVPGEPDKNNKVPRTLQIALHHAAYDSHFHLDRASIILRGSLDLTVEEYLRVPLLAMPDISVDIVGVVLVYCDPDTFPRVLANAEKWRVALGVHPKGATYFTDDHFKFFAEHLADPRVSALGENGLDHTCDVKYWETQEKVFHRLLELATPNKPVVLHIRGQHSETMSESVYQLALDIAKSVCIPEHKFHLHCFHGSKHQVRAWRDAFPNTFFSFSLKVKEFHVDQQTVMLAVPLHRLLTESDSPYTTLGSVRRVNNPRYIGQVALIIAGLRAIPLAEVLDNTLLNGRSLYA